MAKSSVSPELIHLFSVRVLKSHLEVSNKMMDKPRKAEGFEMGASSQSGFNFEKKLMRFRLWLRFIGYDKSQKPIGLEGEYALEFEYHIENLDSFVLSKGEDGSIKVGDDLGATIAAISYSTARGIILERTQGTDFNGIIAPVINPKELLAAKEIEVDGIQSKKKIEAKV